MGCGAGYGGADYESSGTRWEVGGQYSFATYEEASSFRDMVVESHGGRASNPYGSETTRGHIEAEALAAQQTAAK